MQESDHIIHANEIIAKGNNTIFIMETWNETLIDKI